MRPAYNAHYRECDSLHNRWGRCSCSWTCRREFCESYLSSEPGFTACRVCETGRERIRELYQEIQETFRDDTFVGERADHSVRLAEAAGVKKEKIVRSLDDLDDLFL